MLIFIKRRLFLFCVLSVASLLSATHNRAGEISYRHVSGYTWEVTITTYTKFSSIAADRDSLELEWGDGTKSQVPRTSFANMGFDIKQNEYKATHTYPGPALYILRMEDPNRNSDVLNIPNSVNVSFYIESALNFIDPQVFGVNSSPILLNPPMDFANINTPYIHNPAAYDPDGDSLVYSLIDCKGNGGQNIQGYELPDQVSPGNNNNISIDPINGDLYWDSPKQEGEYNVAILITEYRNGIVVGSLIRDMQIIVLDNNNMPPEILSIKDTCVIAGSFLNQTVYAYDMNGDSVTLSGYGGPLEFANNPAVFTEQGAAINVQSTFSWQTSCEDIRRNPYSVIFKATDDFTQGWTEQPLVDLETWRIWVVAPPPQNLISTPVMNNIKLEWDSIYECASSPHFRGFSIWRKEGSNPFVPEACDIGLQGRGYQKIATNIQDYNYIDQSLDRGKSYCYRVLAHFSLGSINFPYNATTSIASNESCTELKQDIPLLTNASVIYTDPFNGKINLNWIKPKANDLDTIQNSGPYTFELYRSNDFNGQNLNLIKSFTSTYFKNYTDTTFIDSGLNTIDEAYSYVIRFKAGNAWIGDCPSASKIHLSIEAEDNALNLSWEYNTPWKNTEFHIYQKKNNTFDSIGVSSDSTYRIENLANGRDYCFKIKSIGQYTDTAILHPLINWSQEDCGAPIDTIPPCPPQPAVSNLCESVPDGIWQENQYYNQIMWIRPSESCGEDIVEYKIYYKANLHQQNTQIAHLFSPNDSSWKHQDLIQSVAGCYSMSAIDSFGNESVLSEEVCIDNCPSFNLPNVFTPNQDGQNDLYTPFQPIRFIHSLEFKVYNRWGNLVFESNDPLIQWDGKSSINNKNLNEGAYFYTCIVNEERLGGVVPNKNHLKGWIQIIR